MRGVTFPLGPFGVTFYCTSRAVGFAIGLRRRLTEKS
jgi:hypothetical protein